MQLEEMIDVLEKDRANSIAVARQARSEKELGMADGVIIYTSKLLDVLKYFLAEQQEQLKKEEQKRINETPVEPPSLKDKPKGKKQYYPYAVIEQYNESITR